LVDFNTAKNYMWGLFYEIQLEVMKTNKHAMVICDVRNSSQYNFVGFSTTATDYIENIIYWPGISPKGSVQRRPVDNNGNWTGTGIFVSPTATVNIFKAIVAAGTRVSVPARTLTTTCKTDSRGTECPIVISTGAPIFDPITNKPFFAEYANFQASVIGSSLNSFAQTIPDSVIILVEKQTGKLMAGT
jgi:hypothetical protein